MEYSLFLTYAQHSGFLISEDEVSMMVLSALCWYFQHSFRSLDPGTNILCAWPPTLAIRGRQSDLFEYNDTVWKSHESR